MMMKINKSTIIVGIFSLILGIVNIAYAANTPAIEFFASNNTQKITAEKAYERLVGKAQHDLKDSIVGVLQENHVEQGKFEKILGMYEMSTDKNVTGDNTEIFHASPLQTLSLNQIFSLASELANSLQQESVAVFIPSNPSPIADIIVSFTSHKPNIAETIERLHEKLPAYATAFSLHLSSTHSGFNNAKVTQIEWIGSKVDINKIKEAFPKESISYHYGQAYLVYKNGQTEQL
jgi:hypothetical protein